MILINLLPEEIRPIKRTPLPYIATVGGLILAIAAMALLWVGNFSTERALQAELATTQADFHALDAVVKEHNDLNQKKLNLKDKISTIQEILSDRKIWSEHLHKLASLTPDNIWYSRIWVHSVMQTMTVEVLDPQTNKPAIDPTTKQPRTERKQVPVPVLEVSGYVVNDAGGVAQVAPLSEATSSDPEFGRHFDFENVSKLEDTVFKTFAVRSFTLQYKIVVDNSAEAAR